MLLQTVVLSIYVQGFNAKPRTKGRTTTKSCLLIMFLCGLIDLAGSPVLAQERPTPGETQEANFKAYVELLHKDLNKDKVSILTEMMELHIASNLQFMR